MSETNDNSERSPRKNRGEKDARLPLHNFYNKNLQPFAHENRSGMTKAEACLWKYALSRGQMKGYNFNRQRPVLSYIADFMCKKLNLIIEVDGITHTFEGAHAGDSRRQGKLEKAGFTVIRFTDNEVLNQIEGVKRVIYDTIVRLEKASPSPPQEEDMLRGNISFD